MMSGMDSNANGAKATRRDSLRAARLANLFCPGLGQLMLGRWRVGLVQLFLFALAVAVGTGLGLMYIVDVYAGVFRAAENSRAPLTVPDPRGLYIAFGAIGFALCIMVWSLWDLGNAGKQSGGDRTP